MQKFIANLSETFRMIKIEHSIFALPFALASAFLAADGLPDSRLLVLILLAMVFARSAAMAFNRYLDADFDAINPRTVIRSIPAGRLTKRYTAFFTFANCILFIGVAWLINPLVFYCSPGILFILLGYSYTKRFTKYCHFILGLALGLSPLGAWLAVRGEFAWLPILLGLAVTSWTAGFDLIYACQDVDFDREHQLHSIPAALGIERSLAVSRLLHLLMFVLLVHIGISELLHWSYWIGVAAIAACLLIEHRLVWGGKLEKVNAAFFTMNGIISLFFGATTILSVLIGKT